MPYKGPHISVSPETFIPRVFGISNAEFEKWPEHVRDTAVALAAELFLVRYNPFIAPDSVRESVFKSLNESKKSLSKNYAGELEKAIKRFWDNYHADMVFREEVVKGLKALLPESAIDLRPNSRIECATDATDLRLELPLLVVLPENEAQVQAVVKLAAQMGFHIIPRGGGSGLTGGAVPAMSRSIILSLSKMKGILSVDVENKLITCESGVITLQAMQAAAKEGLLFTVDPASKAASSTGGNISENSGGPFAFEYGTTIDNIYSYRMVLPSGELIEVKRRDHPRHKIMPEETAIFDILDENGNVKDTVKLPGDQIRGAGLGKDVSNKYLGGLPGVQKEGVDGIITECCFTLYDKPEHMRVLCLEFFGRSMRNAMLVIKDLVAFRDTIREEGDLVKFSALEEFGIKYVQAIEYQAKSSEYQGDPISVIIMQLDSDHADVLDKAVETILDICRPYDNVDVFAARDDKEAEYFWEDRHKLSAISKRTSGFKINEDVVIPLEVIPEFSDFLEEMNLLYAAKAYRSALQDVGRLEGFAVKDEFINMEFVFASKIIEGKVTTAEISDQELEIQIFYFFKDLKSRYPDLAEKLDAVYEKMRAGRLLIANHMHAGDGNCHVNLPVNSNDPVMMKHAHEAVELLFEKVLELKGGVSGEHGIGITKIPFLEEDKLQALKAYKEQIDPENVFNPGKLTTRNIATPPYTFSFNRLIQDLSKTGLEDKETLIGMLKNIQTCTRCGKCKQVCPMYFPQKSIIFHPRNKNLSLGALIEAVYYSQVTEGEPDRVVLGMLRNLTDHCTACGKCMAACPVKIDTAEVTLRLRAFLEDKGAGGHPFKTKILDFLATDPATRLPKAAKFMAVGQSVQNKVVGFLPAAWRLRMENPMFQGPGPEIGTKNLAEALQLSKGALLLPEGGASKEPVLYFPGCGAGLFFRQIGMAAVYLLLKAGRAVIIPPEHLCCGYPLTASGADEAFEANKVRNLEALTELLGKAADVGLTPDTVLTSCGTCREGLKDYALEQLQNFPLQHKDVAQLLLEEIAAGALHIPGGGPGKLLYHAACHAEWSGVSAVKAGPAYAAALSNILDCETELTPGCCGESGLGAMTSPAIYNKLRERKTDQLKEELADYAENLPVLVGCPSCKIGIGRSLSALKEKRPVLHTLEYLAQRIGGDTWEKELARMVRPKSLLKGTAAPSAVRA